MELQEQYDILVKAREWLDDPEHWCKGALWMRFDNKPAKFASNTSKACAVGAMGLAAGIKSDASGEDWKWLFDIRDLLEQKSRVIHRMPLVSTNDKIGYEAVLEVYDSAIAELENKLALKEEVAPEPRELVPA